MARRRVDDDLEPLDRRRGSGAAVFGADVEGGLIGHPALADWAELGLGVRREDDVVVDEVARKGAFGRGGERPDPSGEAARLGGFGRDGGCGRGAEAALGQGGGIAVEDTGRARERGAAFDLDAGDAATLGDDAGGPRGVVETHTETGGKGGERCGEVVHPALDGPDALCFGPPDQGEDAGRMCGTTADIGGVAGKKLDEARVAEMELQKPGEGHAGQERGPEAGLAGGGAGDLAKVGFGRLHHRAVEGGEERGGERVEAPEGSSFAAAGEGFDGREGGLGVGVEIEGGAVGPPVPREDRLAQKGEVIVKPFARKRKEIFEDVAHCEDGGAGVNRACGRGQGAHLATGGGGGVDHGNGGTCGGEADRGGEAAHSGADHHGSMGAGFHTGSVMRHCPV